MRCIPVNKSIGWFFNNHRSLNFEPTYQRDGGAWSLSKKQLFIDSLLNNYDIPKIYLHELSEDGPYRFSVIDGKQRITTIVGFINGDFGLAGDFEYQSDELTKSERPAPGLKFSQMSEAAQQLFKDIQLATTQVQKADDEEIEALFTRLNDGEPLNSAEYRNAFGGKVNVLIRELEASAFFTDFVAYSNKRFAFRETACRLIYIEHWLDTAGVVRDVKKAALDGFVQDYKTMSDSDAQKLMRKVNENLAFMSKCFNPRSKELSKQSLPQLYYIWLRQMRLSYAPANLNQNLRDFIEQFARERLDNNALPEESRDPEISKFSYLSAQGTNNASSMLERCEILTRRYLAAHPETELLDSRRAFTKDEKFVIWLRAGKKCQQCGKDLPTFNDFHGDHVVRHSQGGKTVISNGQALCESCNLQKG